MHISMYTLASFLCVSVSVGCLATPSDEASGTDTSAILEPGRQCRERVEASTPSCGQATACDRNKQNGAPYLKAMQEWEDARQNAGRAQAAATSKCGGSDYAACYERAMKEPQLQAAIRKSDDALKKLQQTPNKCEPFRSSCDRAVAAACYNPIES
jgi:hypothetical protein